MFIIYSYLYRYSSFSYYSSKMLIQRVIILLFLIISIDTHPIDQKIRQRRNIDLMKWQSVDRLFKQLYLNENIPIEIDARTKRSEIQRESRPVDGPINIEQLPAMLAARNVKRYPYSQENDPAIM